MSPNRLFICLVTGIGIAVVGVIDYVSGVEIRVFPLYFLPLSLASWFLNRALIILFSLLAGVVWLLSMYGGGYQYSSPYIWWINYCTQTFAFLFVSFSLASLRGALTRERELSRTDPLTKLPNRLGFQERSEQLVLLCNRRGRGITLAYLDLDNFKTANDAAGHEVGDRMLEQIASILSCCLRAVDLPARFGGDEFLILLPDAMSQDAVNALERVRNAIEQEPTCAAYSVTATIGAVSWLRAPETLQGLTQAADKAMYAAKSLGKNRVYIETHSPSDPMPSTSIKLNRKSA